VSAAAGEIAESRAAAVAVIAAARGPEKAAVAQGGAKVAGAPAAVAGQVGREAWAVVDPAVPVVGVANGGRDQDGSVGVTPPAVAARVRAENAAGSTRMRAIAAAVDHRWEVASGPASGNGAAVCGTRVRRAKEKIATGGARKSPGRGTKAGRRSPGNLDCAPTTVIEAPEWAIPEWVIEIPGRETPEQETESLDRETETRDQETETRDRETETRDQETETRAPATPEQGGVIRADRSVRSRAPVSCPTTSRGIRLATGNSSTTSPPTIRR
jgi:hypothetical protein